MSASGFEPVIGLETHVQLATRTKLFCGCRADFGSAPNSQVCPVCLGLPGVLPVMNREALDLGIRVALALGARVAPFTKFDRKHYFYPDLPKNYQISQYDMPLAREGALEVETDGGGTKRIAIQRVHLEEDAGKMLHDRHPSRSHVDLNRAGVPLLEIVTHPVIGSPAEAVAYLHRLRETVRAVGASECNMEEGSLRCDVNLSLRPRGETGLGVKVEVKNLNSFKSVEGALEHEIGRIGGVLGSGGRVEQETRLWDAARGLTASMRSKESAHDYRYFPEPDLPGFRIPPERIEAVRRSLPELPGALRRRLASDHGLAAYEADLLARDRALCAYFEAVVAAGAPAKPAANWILNDVQKVLNERHLAPGGFPVCPTALAGLLKLAASEGLEVALARRIFEEMLATGADAPAAKGKLGIGGAGDDAAIRSIADQAIRDSGKAVQDYRAGKKSAVQAIVGQAMRIAKGRISPQKLREEIERLLR